MLCLQKTGHEAKYCYTKQKTNDSKMNVVKTSNCNRPGHVGAILFNEIKKNRQGNGNRLPQGSRSYRLASTRIQVNSINSSNNEWTITNIKETIKERTSMSLDTGTHICVIKLNFLRYDTLIDDSIILELQSIHIKKQ